MIAYLLFGLILLGAIVLLLKWFTSVEPRQVKSALTWVAGVIGVVLLLFLLWGGARALAPFALAFLLPMLFRLPSLLRRLGSSLGPQPGQTSTVETRFLRMVLDHDTGGMSGTVREGPWRGRRLDELSEAELLELWRECRAEDEQSAAVLEAYLDRVHGLDWREAAGLDAEEDAGPNSGAGRGEDRRAGARAASGPMTREEALQILGLEAGAGESEIRAAHRRLMRQYHPDSGGSNYLAAKINAAKEVLLGR
ncbi:MAG: DnaJ domain-containing protein [Tistlia sp.]|uniref:DnaJ domain-containing protein n=1 Tax=Tistlia sp. TaxID=3057121 RepID=UPI0034A46130